MIPQAAPISRSAKERRSADSAWPLRCADGRTFAERHSTTRGPEGQPNKRLREKL